MQRMIISNRSIFVWIDDIFLCDEIQHRNILIIQSWVKQPDYELYAHNVLKSHINIFFHLYFLHFFSSPFLFIFNCQLTLKFRSTRNTKFIGIGNRKNCPYNLYSLIICYFHIIFTTYSCILYFRHSHMIMIIEYGNIIHKYISLDSRDDIHIYFLFF